MHVVNFYILCCNNCCQLLLQKRTHEMISMYLIYIKECIDQKGADVTERDMIRLLKDCVVVVTNHGPKHPSKDVVHFSKHYKCDPDLQSNFPG